MTIPADKIPDDIMQEARALFDGYSEDAVILAARAIMKERERGARIAETTTGVFLRIGRRIASAIRNEGEQQP